jgi:DNA ligase D-like protein (predicted 3'-phosphoesterase)
MKPHDALDTYRKKRNFKNTPEPSGGRASRAAKRSIFVIQKHDATRLHYDFRIQSGGVLKSWAVPKGPSLNPKDKRLAMPTEDHPMEYAKFEGVIPDGMYGAGPVIVWDSGTYRNLTEKNGGEVPVEQALRQGRVKIWLEGKKLTGGFALTRIATRPQRWLLVKMNDSEADASRDITVDEPRSVRSRKTIEEIAQRARRITPSKRAA